LGAALRRLSGEHGALRQIEIELNMPSYSRSDVQPEVHARLVEFLRALSGAPFVASSDPMFADSADDESDDESESIAKPDADNSVASFSSLPFSSDSPSLLEFIRLHLSFQPPADAVLPFDSLLRLPSLRCLEVHAEFDYRLDLRSIDALAFPAAGPPLESLSLRMAVIPSSLPSLARLSQLKRLFLVKPDSTPAGSMDLPSGCLAHWAEHMPSLELLMLDGVNIPAGELGSVPQLKQLRLLNQAAMQPSDFASLPSFPQLEDLRLLRVGGLNLQPQSWIEDYTAEEKAARQSEGQPMDIDSADAVATPAAVAASIPASSAAAATAATPPVALPSSLLSLLSACPFLRTLSWLSAPAVLEANVAYTASHTPIATAKGRKRSKAAAEPSSAVLQKWFDLERARDRQALRQLMHRSGGRLLVQLPANTSRRSLLTTRFDSLHPLVDWPALAATATAAAPSGRPSGPDSSASSSSSAPAARELALADAQLLEQERRKRRKKTK
jgi:hypothetical protein